MAAKKTIVPPDGAATDLFYSGDKIRARKLFMEIYERHGRAAAIHLFEDTLKAARETLPIPTKPKGQHHPRTPASRRKRLDAIDLMTVHRIWKSQYPAGTDAEFETFYHGWSKKVTAKGTIVQRLRRARNQKKTF